MSNKLRRKPSKQPRLPIEYEDNLRWLADDYQTLAQFIIGASGCIKPHRRYWEMVSKLAFCLQELDLMRDKHEERLSFFIGNRMVKLGDWRG